MQGFELQVDTRGRGLLGRLWAWRVLPFLAMIWCYKRLLSPLLPPVCRHYPTCSEYTFQAIRQRGVMQGILIGAWRLLRCHPWGTSGYDPVEAFRWPWEPRIPGIHKGACGHDHTQDK
jgi:uncharacterized protein